MTELTSNPPAVSPYGPAEGATGASASARAAQAAEPAWVDRGRLILRFAIWATAGLSVLLMLLIVVLAALGLGIADNDLTESEDTLVWIAVITSPVLFVIALNLLVWRAMLPRLAGQTRGEAFAFITAVTVALAVGSVIVVALLLFFGFLVGAFSSAGSGFGA